MPTERTRRHLRVTSLFSGIGGFELGLHAAGHRTSLFCEIDPEATSVLRRRFPGVKVVSDVRDTDALVESIRSSSQLLTAGFPCTDLSQAGRTLGFHGSQSSLIRDVFRLLDRRPFESVLIENVPNWRVLHRGSYFREVLDELERREYRWAYRTIDARAFGLPQRRQRIFLYASRNRDPRPALFVGNAPETERKYSLGEAAHGFYWTEGSRGLGWGEDCVPTLKGGSSVGIPSPPAILFTNGDLVTPDIRDAERLQGFPAGWTDVESTDHRGGTKPFRSRRRWMLVGNAVNVEIARWIGANLLMTDAPELPIGEVIEEAASLPAAAWFDGKYRRECPLTSFPVRRKRMKLEAFLMFPAERLSLRATKGFLLRASTSSLRFADGFLDAIRNHVERMDTIGQRNLLDESHTHRTLALA